ncbi:hypothetical protein KSS87_018483, partial [Heliosperma pusillum]
MSSSASSKIERKNAPGNRSDPGWEHGTEVDGASKKVKCKYCGGVYRLKHHLAGTHNNVEPCLQVPDEIKEEFRALLDTHVEEANKKKKRLNDIGDEDDYFRMSRNQRTRGAMDSFVTRKGGSTQTTLNQKYKKGERDEVCQQIARFFFTSADNVLKMLDAIVDQVGEENVVQIVTDNAANYKAVGLRLMEKRQKLFWTPCAAHYKWKNNKFGKSVEGKNVQRIVLDTSGFWPGIITCLKAALPLVKVLRMVDSDENPAMSFIYEAVIKAKEQIRANFNNVEKNYKPVWDIADECWEAQMQKPLHVAAYYLNPQFQYSPDFKSSLDVKMADWWDSYGDDCPELKKFAKRILSLTCSSSGCERNWSAFEMVHTKKRNRLHQQKMNDLVFLMYNLRLQRKKQKQCIIQESIILEDLPCDDEWITERVEHVLPSDGAWLSVLDRATRRYARERTSQALDENINADLNATRCPNENVEYQEISDDDIEEVTATLV